jgi:hypothetical protein
MYPITDNTISDLMQFFKCFIVSKYRSDAKNSSNIELDESYFSFVILEPLLNVIKTVTNVIMNPAEVKLMLETSDDIENIVFSIGIDILSRCNRSLIMHTITSATR